MTVNLGKLRLALLASAAASLAFAGPVEAAPITYIFNTEFTGTLDSTTLTAEAVTVTLEADTDNIGTFSDGFDVSADLVSFFFPGLAGGTTATVTTTPMSVYVNNTNSILGFSNDFYLTDLLLFDNPAFATYDLSTSLGPVTPNAFSFLSQFGAPIETSEGTLDISTDVDGVPATFAAVIPEPASLALLGIGGLVLARRRRRA